MVPLPLQNPSQFHVFMVRQTASQITATRMCTIYAQPNYACGPEDVPRERYIIPGAGDTLSGTRLCRTTGRSSSACTAYGRKCPVHDAPTTYKLSDQDGIPESSLTPLAGGALPTIPTSPPDCWRKQDRERQKYLEKLSKVSKSKIYPSSFQDDGRECFERISRKSPF
jgi:hypothetical protein